MSRRILILAGAVLALGILGTSLFAASGKKKPLGSGNIVITADSGSVKLDGNGGFTASCEQKVHLLDTASDSTLDAQRIAAAGKQNADPAIEATEATSTLNLMVKDVEYTVTFTAYSAKDTKGMITLSSGGGKIRPVVTITPKNQQNDSGMRFEADSIVIYKNAPENRICHASGAVSLTSTVNTNLLSKEQKLDAKKQKDGLYRMTATGDELDGKFISLSGIIDNTPDNQKTVLTQAFTLKSSAKDTARPHLAMMDITAGRPEPEKSTMEITANTIEVRPNLKADIETMGISKLGTVAAAQVLAMGNANLTARQDRSDWNGKAEELLLQLKAVDSKDKEGKPIQTLSRVIRLQRLNGQGQKPSFVKIDHESKKEVMSLHANNFIWRNLDTEDSGVDEE